jgi:hypothetical protein
MENTKLLFGGTERSETFEVALQLYANDYDEVFILIRDFEDDDLITNQHHICISKQTAIKLSKELKKQISLLGQL